MSIIVFQMKIKAQNYGKWYELEFRASIFHFRWREIVFMYKIISFWGLKAFFLLILSLLEEIFVSSGHTEKFFTTKIRTMSKWFD